MSIWFVILGVLISSVFSLLPALHIYNLAALLFITKIIYIEWVAHLMLGMILGFSIINAIPAIFLGTPDEGSIFFVLPGQKYMLQGRAHESVLLSGVGSLIGIFSFIAIIPVILRIIPNLRIILSKNAFWVIGAVIVYMLISEWPKGGSHGSRIYKFGEAWKQLFAGILTFVLSGLLGLILFYKPIIPITKGFQNLMPAFVGLFSIPWIIMNILSKTEIPFQNIVKSIDVSYTHLLQATIAGILGGLFAIFIPGVTCGIGCFLAGQATAQREDRTFILAQGVTKTIYYVGGFLLFLVPGLEFRRGGLSWILSSVYRPSMWADFYQMIAGCLIGAMIAFLLLDYFSKIFCVIIDKFSYKKISYAVLIIIVILVFEMTGVKGLLIATISTMIGLIPLLFNSRRMNCLGVILLPLFLNFTGYVPSFLIK